MPYIWNNKSIIITQENNNMAIITSINHKSYFVEFLSTINFISLLNEPYQQSFQNGKLYSLEIPNDNIIKSARIFNYGHNYLLIFYKSIANNRHYGTLKIFKQSNENIHEMNFNEFSSIIDYDLMHWPDTKLTLLSIIQYNNNGSQLAKLFYWSISYEQFQDYSSIQIFENYYLTRITPIANRLFVIYGQLSSFECKSSFNNYHNIHLFEIVTYGEKISMKYFQRIKTRLNKIQGIIHVNIGSTASYILVYSSSNIELYQYHGYNQFELIANFKLLTNIENISYYWIRGEQLYLSVTSGNGKNLILSSIISGIK